MSIVPNTRPKQEEDVTLKIISDAGITDKVVLVGVRGYYLKTMGDPKKDDFNIYDDAIYIVSPTAYASFNANVDPSFVMKKNKPMAVLDCGVYRFYKGKHGGRYNALRAYPEGVVLPCTRAGAPSTATYINIHKGGDNINDKVDGVTWSKGCQTIYKPQWSAFINLVYSEMDRNGQQTVPYILVENK